MSSTIDKSVPSPVSEYYMKILKGEFECQVSIMEHFTRRDVKTGKLIPPNPNCTCPPLGDIEYCTECGQEV